MAARGNTQRRGSTTLLAFWPDRGHGPGGRARCRYCAREVEPGERLWCSERCRKKALHAFSLANDPAYQRRAVWKRDRGQCAACGRDTLALRHQLQAAPTACPTSEAGSEREQLYSELLREGYDRHRLDRFVLWEMDHIQPVIEGGGGTGLDNLQTLCVPCHKGKTAALLRRRRAEQQGLQDLFGE